MNITVNSNRGGSSDSSGFNWTILITGYLKGNYAQEGVDNNNGVNKDFQLMDD